MHEQMRRERIESGFMGTLSTPREVQFWELLKEANEVNQRRSYRWRVDPPSDPTGNGAVPAATTVE
jgi:hypothetical protein